MPARRTITFTGVTAVLATTAALTGGLVPGVAAVGGSDPLGQVRQATREYRDVDRAVAAGYVQFFGCVHEPLAGAMGTHFVNQALVGDGAIDATRPEALMYDVRPDGRLELLGAEYVVFKEAWDAGHSAPPRLFGQSFATVTTPNRYGLPAFYELHAWAWRTNPTGANKDWNPRVLCVSTEGHAT
ncbi:hypothetical protein [Kineosporia sp. A_224]|uniref:hypothetical protein n=1 Tax=Kineosporia sp. A_224 TaxID=1962180 RepID=UPI000B4B7E73|nr:hypothetical protein [Kineosporia sp. A_224]